MQRWEYQELMCDRTAKSFSQWINDRGDLGWELVHIENKGFIAHCVFKRAKAGG